MPQALPGLALAAFAALFVLGCGAGDAIAPTPEEAAGAAPERVGTTPGQIRPPVLAPGRFSLRVDRTIGIRRSPGGPVVGRVKPRSPFGSNVSLPVVGRRGNWLQVMSRVTPNDTPGYVRVRGSVLVRQPYTIVIDRSARSLTVRRGGIAVRQMAVGIGAPGTETPLGRAGVTDTLVYPTGSGVYGCCAVALTSKQTKPLPASWKGGRQLAIHGTADESDVGRAVSLGCLRGRNVDLRWLVRTIPVGTLVTTVA